MWLKLGSDTRPTHETAAGHGLDEIKSKTSILPWIAAALALAALFEIYLFSSSEPKPAIAMPKPTVVGTAPAAAPEPAASVIKPAPATTPAPAPAPVPPAKQKPATPAPKTADTKPATPPGSRARAIIAELKQQQGAADLDRIFTSAEDLKAEGMLADAHLLYFYAAKQGHAPSAMALGMMHDPDYHSKLTSIMDKPDPAQAYKWYSQAAESGNLMARAHLDDLRARVELAAAGGDATAKRLLLQWQKQTGTGE